MIRSIVDTINQRLNYSFKDVLLGVVHPHDYKGRLIPASSDGTTYPEAIPDSSKTSIVYWEDYGSKTVVQTAWYRFVDHELRLIVWLNFDKIEEPYDYCIRAILHTLPKRVGKVTITLAGQIQKGNNIFSRYDYEDRKQYITWPYDAIAFNVIVRYPETSCPPVSTADDAEE